MTRRQVFEHLRTFATFSRIDLALDEYEGLVGFTDIIKKIERGEHVGRCRSLRLSVAEVPTVNTLAQPSIWVATSQTLCSVYMKKITNVKQKGYEIDVPIWNRWELVLKHEKANDFVTRYLEDGHSFGSLFGDPCRFNTFCRTWRGHEQKQMADIYLVE